MPRSREIHEWLDEWSAHLTDADLEHIFRTRDRGRIEVWLDQQITKWNS